MGVTLPSANHVFVVIGEVHGFTIKSSLRPFAQVGVRHARQVALLVTLHVVLEQQEQQVEVAALGIQGEAHRGGHADGGAVGGECGCGRDFGLGGLGKFVLHVVQPELAAGGVAVDVVPVDGSHRRGNDAVAVHHAGGSCAEIQVTYVRLRATTEHVAGIIVEGNGDEAAAIEAADLLDGQDAQRTVDTVHACVLLEHDVLLRLERQVANRSLHLVGRFIQGHHDCEIVGPSGLQRQLLREAEGVAVALAQAQALGMYFADGLAGAVAQRQVGCGESFVGCIDGDAALDGEAGLTDHALGVVESHQVRQIVDDTHIVHHHEALRGIVIEEGDVDIPPGKFRQGYAVVRPFPIDATLRGAGRKLFVEDERALGQDAVCQGARHDIIGDVALVDVDLQPVRLAVEVALALKFQVAEAVGQISLGYDHPVFGLAGRSVVGVGRGSHVGARLAVADHPPGVVLSVGKAQGYHLCAGRLLVSVVEEHRAQSAVEILREEYLVIVGNLPLVGPCVVQFERFVGIVAGQVGDDACGNFHSVVAALVQVDGRGRIYGHAIVGIGQQQLCDGDILAVEVEFGTSLRHLDVGVEREQHGRAGGVDAGHGSALGGRGGRQLYGDGGASVVGNADVAVGP